MWRKNIITEGKENLGEWEQGNGGGVKLGR